MHERHGMIHTRIYTTWHNMRCRCDNPNHKSYKNYGGRGITYCAEWHDFPPFMEWALSHGYNDSLTLDRIDTNGNYEPSNCKWSTPKEQCNNRRNNKKFTFNGETLTLSEWADKLHISRHTLWGRIKIHHMSIEQALTMPVGASRGKNHFAKLITFNGETLNQKQWAERLGMHPTSLQRRLDRMPVEEALTLPKKR